MLVNFSEALNWDFPVRSNALKNFNSNFLVFTLKRSKGIRLNYQLNS